MRYALFWNSTPFKIPKRSRSLYTCMYETGLANISDKFIILLLRISRQIMECNKEHRP
jgi:hypothetical protein